MSKYIMEDKWFGMFFKNTLAKFTYVTYFLNCKGKKVTFREMNWFHGVDCE